ncbi:MAG: hypothetical protein A2Y94_04755 [Caldithrix sp. RBG_13_44_9]|nr:MAG: hypothetical protein A2Y94_04755 [Caldithrix sp. RBG_13_44_9]
MKSFFSLIFLTVFTTLLWANAVIIEWKAEPEQSKIILQWKTSQEDEVVKFVVERSTDNSHFFDIGEVTARGPGFQYRFEDNKLGFTNSIFYYRLKIVNNDGSYHYTDTLPVIPNISSISRSWGSIKALFR